MGAVNTIELIIKGTDNATSVISGVKEKLVGSFSSVGTSMAKMGAMGGLAVAPVAAVLKNATDHAVDFDTALTSVQSVLGSTDAETDKLGDSILAIGMNSKEGPQAAAEAFYDIVSGVSDASTHMAILDAAIATSEAGASELKGTTNALVSIMNSYSYSAEDASMVSDVLTRAVGMGVMTMDELGAAIPSVTGLANSMGIGFDDLAGSMAYLTTKGFSAGEATTQLKASMAALMNPNAALVEAFEELGVTSGEALVKQYGMVGALQKIAGTSAASKNGLAKTLGSVEALNGVLALTGEGADEFLEKFEGGMEGATDAAQAVQMGGAQAQMDLFNSAVDGLKITVGTALIPTMTSLINTVRPIVMQFAAWAQQHPELIGQIAKVVAIVGALSGGLTIVGGIIATVGTVLGVILSPIGLVIAAVAGLYLAWKENFLGIQEALQPVIDLISSLYDIVSYHLGNIIKYILEGDFQKAFAVFKSMWDEVGANIAAALPSILEALSDFGERVLAWIIETAPKVAQKLLDWATAFVDWVLPFIPPLLAKLGELAQKLVGWIGEQIPDWVAKLKEWATAFVDWVKEVAPPLLEKAGDLAKDLLKWIGDKAPEVLNQLGDWVGTFIDWVIPAAAGLIEKLPDLLSDLLKWVLDVAPDIINQLLEWMGAFVEWAGDAIPPLLEKLGELLDSLIEWVLSDLIPSIIREAPGIVAAIIQFAVDAVTEIGPKLLEFLETLGNFFINDLIPAVVGFAGDIASGLIDGIVGGIGNLAGDLEDAIMDLLSDSLPGWAKKALGIESPSTVAAGWGENVILGMMQGLATGEDPTKLMSSMQKIVAVLVNSANAIKAIGKQSGEGVITSMATAITGNVAQLAAPVEMIKSYVSGLVVQMSASGNYAGANLVFGLATGIYNNVSAAVAAVQYLGYSLQSALKAALGIYSPSRVFEGFGENVTAGFAKGLENTDAAMRAMDAFSGGVMGAPFTPGGAGGNASISISISVPITEDVLRQYPQAEEYGRVAGQSTADRLVSEMERRGFGVAVNG